MGFCTWWTGYSLTREEVDWGGSNPASFEVPPGQGGRGMEGEVTYSSSLTGNFSLRVLQSFSRFLQSFSRVLQSFSRVLQSFSRFLQSFFSVSSDSGKHCSNWWIE